MQWVPMHLFTTPLAGLRSRLVPPVLQGTPQSPASSSASPSAIEPSLFSWPWFVEHAEALSNLTTAAVAVLGLFAIFKWLRERRDRNADVLFKMEELFQTDGIAKGRGLLDINYQELKPKILDALGKKARNNEQIIGLDALLRFYLVLYGMFASGQINRKAARVCYRYYLALYHSTAHSDFGDYVDRFYPTLRQWAKPCGFHPVRWLRDRYLITDRDLKAFGLQRRKPPTPTSGARGRTSA